MRLELGVEAALEDAADQKGSLDGVGGPARLDHGLDLVHQTGRVSDIGNRRQQELARERLAHAADAHISFRSRTCLYSDRGSHSHCTFIHWWETGIASMWYHQDD